MIRFQDRNTFNNLSIFLISGDSVESEGYIYILSPPVIYLFSMPENIDEGNILSISCTGSGTPTPNVTVTHQVSETR